MRTLPLFTVLLAALLASAPRIQPYRSPIDLVLLPGGERALTANHSSDTISFLDLTQGKVLEEQPCGRKPAAIACSRDGKHVAVSNLWSGTVSFFAIDGSSLKPDGQASVGAFPRGLVFSADGSSLYVALAGADAVIELDCRSRTIAQRWPAGREPRQLALSSDGAWLAVACSRSAQVHCWNTRTRRLHWRRTIEDGFNLRGLAFLPEGQGLVCAHVVRREFPVSKDNIEEGWVIDSRLTRLALEPDARPATWQLALDTRGKAVGDPHGLAGSSDGRWLAVTGSGTQELLLLDSTATPWNSGDPGDFVDARLVLRRLSLGGRPLTAAFTADGKHVVVANYLLDAVQVVDASAGKLLRSIALGNAQPPPLAKGARRGEALFYDARRSHHQWFSCHTCHVDGHTCGLTFDTLNDASYGNPKLTPTLRHVTRTGPWTWHGWQKDLGAAVVKSFTETMFGPKPTTEEVTELLSFLATLEHPPQPHRAADGEDFRSLEDFGSLRRDRVRRGQVIFQEKARCLRCHEGEHYSSESNYDVKLEADGSPYPRWNPPSLRGLFDRGPYLHDGRAKTLEDLLDKHHAPEMLGGKALTETERRELLEFLRSL